DTLPLLTDAELEKLGVSLGHRKKLLQAIGNMRSDDAPARPRSPDSYTTPKYLAEKILASRATLEGERKQVTVLFADLKGSMELLADRDPEDARHLLDAVLERMLEAVHRYEGTVNQVMGDGIMALFGAPLAHEDHAVRACYAALRMQDRVSRWADEVQRREGLSVRIRVGLNSGEVVVRSIANDLRMDYTAVGQTTHLAARMEQMAAPGTILITPGTLRLAESVIRANPLGPRAVKGLDAPLSVHELVGAVHAHALLRAAATRRLSRFVGRRAERARLDARERRRRVLDALTRVFLKEGDRQPLLLVFENLQWADAETLAVLDGLLERIPSSRLILVLDYRPELDHEWRRHPAFSELALAPLDPATVAAP